MPTFLSGTTLGTKPPGGDRLVQDAAPKWGSKNPKERVFVKTWLQISVILVFMRTGLVLTHSFISQGWKPEASVLFFSPERASINTRRPCR